jgi:cyclohexanone monooxygenase
VPEELVDVVVVGGGLGGVYASYRFAKEGLSVAGIEGGSTFGGVWYHNRYPGSRIDTDSLDYCFHFSKDIYDKWRWKERYASAAELLEYINFVADICDVRRLFRFNSWLRQARWAGDDARWHLRTDGGDQVACRFLVMCAGNLSEPKPINFPGLDRFAGEWVQTNRWPDRGVSFAGRRVGIVGTGSSGVQAIPVVAEAAEQVFVFQRHPHYAIPARNWELDPGEQEEILQRLDEERERQLTAALLPRGMDPPRPVAEFRPEQRRALLERQWEYGGHGMSYLFADQGIDHAANELVAEFVHEKIRDRVPDPVLAEKLTPAYPIGTRRLILEFGYYEVFNRDNVALVDVLADPIQEIIETGVRTASGATYDVDLLMFAVGFRPFQGSLDAAGIRNDQDQSVGRVWSRGPLTFLGLMTPGFPNLFHPTNAGSPSVLGNAVLQHEFLADWITELISHMDESGYSNVEASEEACDQWGSTVASYAERLLRRQENQYMTHVNEDGTRVFIPFAGGMNQYVPRVRAIAANGYRGLTFH